MRASGFHGGVTIPGIVSGWSGLQAGRVELPVSPVPAYGARISPGGRSWFPHGQTYPIPCSAERNHLRCPSQAGGIDGFRTHGLMIPNHALYRLSYYSVCKGYAVLPCQGWRAMAGIEPTYSSQREVMNIFPDAGTCIDHGRVARKTPGGLHWLRPDSARGPLLAIRENSKATENHNPWWVWPGSNRLRWAARRIPCLTMLSSRPMSRPDFSGRAFLHCKANVPNSLQALRSYPMLHPPAAGGSGGT